MTREEMIAALDDEILRLESVRELLGQSKSDHFAESEFGFRRPKKQRVLSADARERIAQAQRRRWAKHRGEAVSL